MEKEEAVVDTRRRGSQSERQLADLKRQYHNIQERFKETSGMIAGHIEELSVPCKDSSGGKQRQRPASVIQRRTHSHLPEVTIRKDFKIEGQIGEKEQKGNLSYTNLLHQIELGLQRGYLESEIVEAVVNAISPGLSIRGMLEMKNGLTLVQLRRILKSYYKEEDAAELYHQLINMAQSSQETPHNFLFRAIELKDRLLSVSKGEDSDEHFGAELIQKKFLRSVATGLRSDYIKFQLRQYLDDPFTTDEVLIEETNEAAKMEMEREKKQRKIQSSTTVRTKGHQSEILQGPQEPSVLTVNTDQMPWSLPVQHLPQSELGKLFQMQKEMLEMMALLTAKLVGPQREEVPAPKTPMDPTAAQTEKPAKPKTCFNCGGVGHYRQVCPSPAKPETKRQKPAENFRGPQ